jgi:outer membrane protein TolC
VAGKQHTGRAVLDELRRGVTLQQENLNLARINFDVGRISRLNLCEAEILLIEARLKLEAAEQKPATALLEELVRLREEEARLIDLRFEMGVAPQTEVLSARSRLSDARARLAAAQDESQGSAKDAKER